MAQVPIDDCISSWWQCLRHIEPTGQEGQAWQGFHKGQGEPTGQEGQAGQGVHKGQGESTGQEGGALQEEQGALQHQQLMGSRIIAHAHVHAMLRVTMFAHKILAVHMFAFMMLAVAHDVRSEHAYMMLALHMRAVHMLACT